MRLRWILSRCTPHKCLQPSPSQVLTCRCPPKHLAHLACTPTRAWLWNAPGLAVSMICLYTWLLGCLSSTKLVQASHLNNHCQGHLWQSGLKSLGLTLRKESQLHSGPDKAKWIDLLESIWFALHLERISWHRPSPDVSTFVSGPPNHLFPALKGGWFWWSNWAILLKNICKCPDTSTSMSPGASGVARTERNTC